MFLSTDLYLLTIIECWFVFYFHEPAGKPWDQLAKEEKIVSMTNCQTSQRREVCVSHEEEETCQTGELGGMEFAKISEFIGSYLTSSLAEKIILIQIDYS